jgi:hypothetical protein
MNAEKTKGRLVGLLRTWFPAFIGVYRRSSAVAEP